MRCTADGGHVVACGNRSVAPHRAPGTTTRGAWAPRDRCVPDIHDIAHPTCGTTDADPGICVFPAPLVD